MASRILSHNRKTEMIITKLIIFLLIFSCSTTQNSKKYSHTLSSTDNSEQLEEINYHFKKTNSFVKYFFLKQNTQNIEIKITGKYSNKDYRLNSPVQFFFIVEKAVVMDKINQEFSFTEISHNYSNEWIPSEMITIYSIANDPLKKLNSSVYRIVFTCFMNKSFKSKIEIGSNSDFLFIDDSEIKTYLFSENVNNK